MSAVYFTCKYSILVLISSHVCCIVYTCKYLIPDIFPCLLYTCKHLSPDIFPCLLYTCKYLSPDIFPCLLYTCKYLSPEVSLIVPDFTIFVYDSSCNSLFFGPILLIYSLAFRPALGVPVNRKKNKRSKNETKKERVT